MRISARMPFRSVTLVAFLAVLACGSPPGDEGPLKRNARGWSPDGSRLVFNVPWHGPAEAREIFVTDTLGTVTNLTCNDVEDGNPAWSPDGNWIAYFGRIDPWLQILLIRPDGSGRRQFTHAAAHSHSPEWAPDGRRLVFESNRDGDWELYVAARDSGAVTRLTHTPSRDGRPSWSGVTDSIVFYSNRDGDDEIFVAAADVRNPVALTAHDSTDYNPSWHERHGVLFVSNRDGDDEIFRRPLGGGPPIQLTFNDATDWNPYASPDGNTISFYSDRSGGEGLYLMNADGSAQRVVVSPEQIERARAACAGP